MALCQIFPQYLFTTRLSPSTPFAEVAVANLAHLVSNITL